MGSTQLLRFVSSDQWIVVPLLLPGRNDEVTLLSIHVVTYMAGGVIYWGLTSVLTSKPPY